jgi:hypothetical protein
MAKINDAQPDTGARQPLPSHIILLADWAGHPAGRVFRGDPDLIGKLDIAGARFREATTFERRIGGFVD